MEMSNDLSIPELHVAQQRRRDKLRFQHFEELQANTNFHHHSNSSNSNVNEDINMSSRNNVNVASAMMVVSPEMFNYSANQLANIQPTRFVAPSSSDSCDAQHNHQPPPLPPPPLQNWVPSFVHSNQVDYHNSSHHDDEIDYQTSVQSWGACNNNNNELPLLPGHLDGGVNDAITSSYAPRHGRGLSLSLSSNQVYGEYPHQHQHQMGEEQELKPFESGGSMKLDCGSSSHHHVQYNNVGGSSIHLHRNNNNNVGPLGPFTGYASILKSSKFLKPAQHLLDELFGAAGVWGVHEDSDNDVPSRGHNNNVVGDSSIKLRGSSNDLSGRTASCDSYIVPDCHQRKAKLLHMQEEVCKRQKQYHQQMQMVLSAFESVPGLSNATPYISRSLKTISRHFRCIKNAIADQLKHIKRALGEDLSSYPTSFMKGDSSSSLRYDQNFAKLKSGTMGGTSHVGHQAHVWRPQRGLPERAVSILRAWLFDHFLHPYPTDNDKQMLASQTGLTRNQVSNWFINARVRLWKPMVEEIHTLERKSSPRSEPDSSNSTMSAVVAQNRQLAAGGNKFSGCKPPLSPACDSKQLESSGPSNSLERSRGRETSTEQLFQKCSRIETQHQVPSSMDSPFIGFLPYQRRGFDLGEIGVVSLTLGLRHGSDTTQQQLQHQFVPQGVPFGSHVIHDFSG